MSVVRVEKSAVIHARPEVIFAVLRDYRVGHPAILPKPEFEALNVEKGGEGTGTEYYLRMRVWGQVYEYHHVISEPEPGRLLVETDRATGKRASWFTLDPLNDGKDTQVTITAEFPAAPGISGWIQRLFQPGVVGKLFARELRLLDEYVRKKTTTSPATI